MKSNTCLCMYYYIAFYIFCSALKIKLCNCVRPWSIRVARPHSWGSPSVRLHQLAGSQLFQPQVAKFLQSPSSGLENLLISTMFVSPQKPSVSPVPVAPYPSRGSHLGRVLLSFSPPDNSLVWGLSCGVILWYFLAPCLPGYLSLQICNTPCTCCKNTLLSSYIPSPCLLFWPKNIVCIDLAYCAMILKHVWIAKNVSF